MVEVEVNTIQGNENSSTLHRLLMKRTARSCKRLDNYQSRNRNASRLFNHFSIKPDARTTDSNTASIREVENAMRTLREDKGSTGIDSLIRISPITSNISYGNSSFQEGTPISKTKRPERHKFHCWISKIQVHKRRRALNRLRKANVTASNDNCEPYQKKNYDFNDDENKEFENDVYIKNFPNEAFSCYNQFKTTDFSDIFNGNFFDKCSTNNNLENNSYNNNHKTANSEAENEVDIPLFSPINELTYENLQILREQVFGLPPFSADSEINVEELSRMPSIIEVDSSDDYDKRDAVELPTTADTADHSDQIQQTRRSTELLDSQVYNLPTPEIIKHLFVDTTVRMTNSFEIESPQVNTMLNKLDDIVAENYSSELTPIEGNHYHLICKVAFFLVY